ncbi:MAG: PcfJ domain-containing protein [Treponema sp.]|nr:PcfJ domain-containing protein [Treponema sp.]
MIFKKNKTEHNKSTEKKNNLEEYYFCRNLDSTYSMTSENPENKRLIFFNPQENFIFCPYHLKWELAYKKENQVFFGCGKKADGFLFDFRPINFSEPKFNSDSGFSPYYYTSMCPKDVNSLEYYNFNWPFVFNRTLDSNGISKDLLYIKLCFNKDTKTFSVQLSILDRPKIQTGQPSIAINYPTRRIYYSYNIQSGKFITDRSSDKTLERIFAKLAEVLPKNVYEFICQKVKEKLRGEFGQKLEFNYSGSKEYIQAMVSYPYEPNIYEIAEETGIEVERENSDIYNQFCEKYGIKSYRTLRKAFNKNPRVLIVYKRALDSAFTDVNMLNRIINSDLMISFFDKYYTQNTKFCIQKIIENRGLIPALNLIERNMKNSQINDSLFDTAYMFCENFTSFNEDVKKLFYKKGFCRESHDVMSETIYKINHEKKVFNYSEKDYELEDEIEGYEFKLPEDSYKLYDIGIKMNNCVGSYVKKIINKDCRIVYAIKEDEYKLCIEVRGDLVWQRRIDYNKDPEGDELKVVELWQKNHKLIFNGNSF